MGDTLVVFYSRTGTTRKAAEALAQAGGWDLAEIQDEATLAGRRGPLRSVIEAVFGREPKVQYFGHDPGLYDLVIIATPVWASNIASPVRSFLTQYRARMKRVSFLCTLGGSGAETARKRFAAACGKVPLDSLALTSAEMQSGSHAGRIESFARRLRAAVT